MNRPPTPPTTPHTKLQEPVTRLPVEICKKFPREQTVEPEAEKLEREPLEPAVFLSADPTKLKPLHIEATRQEFADVCRSATSSPEQGKTVRPPPKVQISQMAADLAKPHRPKTVAVVLPANKPAYQNAKSVKVPQNQILTGAVASSPPGVAKASPPARELHPMTGAVASPPPRAPHLASQQPIVTGASSSRALIDAPKGPAASPRGLTIPPYEAALVSSKFLSFKKISFACQNFSFYRKFLFVRTQHTPSQSLHSPPPAHQQVFANVPSQKICFANLLLRLLLNKMLLDFRAKESTWVTWAIRLSFILSWSTNNI